MSGLLYRCVYGLFGWLGGWLVFMCILNKALHFYAVFFFFFRVKSQMGSK